MKKIKFSTFIAIVYHLNYLCFQSIGYKKKEFNEHTKVEKSRNGKGQRYRNE